MPLDPRDPMIPIVHAFVQRQQQLLSVVSLATYLRICQGCVAYVEHTARTLPFPQGV
jgi:hypothetical protein